mmetsp:Transcript_2038/g.7378  ORF Transcript_2038/g.7378 Transcript_2038/m.7378 type:complete len:626 (+) Transcript_2038:44-1921(+)
MGTVPSSLDGGTPAEKASTMGGWPVSTMSAARCRPRGSKGDGADTPTGDNVFGQNISSQSAGDAFKRPAPRDAANGSNSEGVPGESGSSKPTTINGHDSSAFAEQLASRGLGELPGEPGYDWAQYGTKQIHGGQRLYLKCRYAGCSVKKIVETLAGASEDDAAGGASTREKFEGVHSHGPTIITMVADSCEKLRELVWKISGSAEEGAPEPLPDIKTYFIICSDNVDVFDDGYAWRKYGEKKVKGFTYKRAYYRCSASKNCAARKTVEFLDEHKTRATYKAVHNHACPSGTPADCGASKGAHLMTPRGVRGESAKPHAVSQDAASASAPTAPKDAAASRAQLGGGSAQECAQHPQLLRELDVGSPALAHVQPDELQPRQGQAQALLDEQEVQIEQLQQQHQVEQLVLQQQQQQLQLRQQAERLALEHRRQRLQQQHQQQQQAQQQHHDQQQQHQQLRHQHGQLDDEEHNQQLHAGSGVKFHTQPPPQQATPSAPAQPREHRFHPHVQFQHQLQLQYMNQELRQQAIRESERRSREALQQKAEREAQLQLQRELNEQFLHAPVQDDMLSDQGEELLFLADELGYDATPVPGGLETTGLPDPPGLDHKRKRLDTDVSDPPMKRKRAT